MKEDESRRFELGWDAKRQLTKINYRIHTDSIQRHIIPHLLTQKEILYTYTSEADTLNKALFGMTAKEWREANPDKDGNIRDYADVEHLICLANLETLNAHFIQEGKNQSERLSILNIVAVDQMNLLLDSPAVKKLKPRESEE